jgi:hypothetical protein
VKTILTTGTRTGLVPPGRISFLPTGLAGIPHRPQEPHPSPLNHVRPTGTGLRWRLLAMWRVLGTIAPKTLHVARIFHVISVRADGYAWPHTGQHGERASLYPPLPRREPTRRAPGSAPAADQGALSCRECPWHGTKEVHHGRGPRRCRYAQQASGARRWRRRRFQAGLRPPAVYVLDGLGAFPDDRGTTHPRQHGRDVAENVQAGQALHPVQANPEQPDQCLIVASTEH